jgi:hypothetical protein
MMATKSESPGKKTAKRKTAAAAPGLTDKAAIVLLESAQSETAPGTDSVDRRELVAAEAYFLAERRGFAAGHELEDWIAAEVAVDSRLQRMQAA